MLSYHLKLIQQVFIVLGMDPNMVPYIELTRDYLKEAIKKAKNQKENDHKIFLNSLYILNLEIIKPLLIYLVII